MEKNEKIFIGGGNGMVGRAIKKVLIQEGYGDPNLDGEIHSPTRTELDLMNYSAVEDWFTLNNPTIVIIAAAKVGGIFANSTKPYDFIFENLKIETNIIELSRKFGVKNTVLRQ